MQIMAQCNKKKKEADIRLWSSQRIGDKNKHNCHFDRPLISLPAKDSWMLLLRLNTAAMIQARRCIDILTTSTHPSTAHGYSATKPVAVPTKRRVGFLNAALSKVTTVKQHKMQVRLLQNADSAQMVS